MKSNKLPTMPPNRTELEEVRPLNEEIKTQLIEILPKQEESLVNLMSRAKFIHMMNGVMERVGQLDAELNNIEELLLDKDGFVRLPIKEKVQIYRAIERRQATMRSDAIRVTEIGSRTDYNRNYFGIQAQLLKQEREEQDTAGLLTKPAKQVLSEISKFVTLKTGGIVRTVDGDNS